MSYEEQERACEEQARDSRDAKYLREDLEVAKTAMRRAVGLIGHAVRCKTKFDLDCCHRGCDVAKILEDALAHLSLGGPG